ncbi:MAG: hypothetical protein LBG80_19805 [Bacteroidales bacterium]|nr:hypothetical protein [Bacteroidales bacterium]
MSKFVQESMLCEPIKQLIDLFNSCGFTIDKQELRDWHFNEFEIIMRGEQLKLPHEINVNNIERYNENTYICKCHWSTLRLIFENDKSALNVVLTKS